IRLGLSTRIASLRRLHILHESVVLHDRPTEHDLRDERDGVAALQVTIAQRVTVLNTAQRNIQRATEANLRPVTTNSQDVGILGRVNATGNGLGDSDRKASEARNTLAAHIDLRVEATTLLITGVSDVRGETRISGETIKVAVRLVHQAVAFPHRLIHQLRCRQLNLVSRLGDVVLARQLATIDRLATMQDSQVDLASQGTGSLSADLLQHIHRVGLDSLHGEFHAHHSLDRPETLRPDLHVGLLLILALTDDRGGRALSQRRDSVLA